MALGDSISAGAFAEAHSLLQPQQLLRKKAKVIIM